MRHPLLPRRAELGLPLASGILLALSFPPFHLLIPTFVALVPYLVFVGRCPLDRSGSATVRRATFWMAILFYGVLLYWLFAALVFYTWLALLGYAITVVLHGLVFGAAGWAVHVVRSRHRTPFWVSLPVFWTAAEWVRAHLGDIAFPWLDLGYSLSGYPALVGFADIGGVRGVTFWIVAINGLLAEWWLQGLRRGAARRALALALLVGLPVAYSLVRWATLDTRPAATVLVVQPNIPEDLKLQREAALDSSRIALDKLTREALELRPDVQLIAWPETAQPYFYDQARDWTAWAVGLARESETPLLFGTLDIERFEGGGYEYYNAALYLDANGAGAGLYRKRYLVPVVERVPFIPIAWIRDLRVRAARGWRLPLIGDIGSFFRWFGGYGRGEEEPVMAAAGAGFGVLICYESIFPGLSRRYRKNGADFLVNITNDAWFGREHPWWSRTSALFQHPAHLVMRAIENRAGIARAANTGISMFVDPRGRVHQATPLFQPDARVGSVETADGLTLYTRLGDWPGGLAALGGALILLVGWWRGRGRGPAGRPEVRA